MSLPAGTVDRPETRPGVVMGTLPYMSPEQASGQPLDFRTDQFSLGSILYEMVTGRRPFEGKTGPETLAAIIREEPRPIGELAPGTPTPLRWIEHGPRPKHVVEIAPKRHHRMWARIAIPIDMGAL